MIKLVKKSTVVYLQLDHLYGVPCSTPNFTHNKFKRKGPELADSKRLAESGGLGAQSQRGHLSMLLIDANVFVHYNQCCFLKMEWFSVDKGLQNNVLLQITKGMKAGSR